MNRRMALAALATLGALAASEAAFRLHEGALVFVGDEPGRRFATRPLAHGTNAMGYHEREPPFAADPIVVLGDSTTYGSTTAAETWTRSAEHLLARPILNFAHYGYDAGDCLAVLRRDGWRVGPAAVVYAAYVNDLVPTELITVGPRAWPVWVGDGPLPIAWWRSSAMLRVGEGAWMARGYTEREDPAALAGAIAAMAGEAGDHGVPFLVFGLVPHVVADEDVRRAHDIEALAEPRFASVLPYLRASGRTAFYPHDASDREHFGAEGHRFLGAAFADVWRRFEAGQPLPRVDDAPIRVDW